MPKTPRDQEDTGRDAKGRFTASGNPKGRPQEYRAFKLRCAEFMDAEGFDKLVALARDRSEFALRLMAEYAYGKPQQQLIAEVEHKGGVTIYLPERRDARGTA